MNSGTRFSKHRLLGTPPAVTIPVLPARSRVQEEQWDTSVPAGVEVGAGSGSWQCCPAWQGSHGPDLSGFENRMGTRRTFVFSLGAGTRPSGCSWDVAASRLWWGWGPSSDTPGNLIAPLHPSPILSFISKSQSCPCPLPQPGWLGKLPWEHRQG